MKKNTHIGIFRKGLNTLFLLIVSYSWAEEVVFVQAEKTKLLVDSKMGSAVAGEVTRGTSLKVLELKGGWYKVEVEGKTGFISKLFVSKTAPVGVAQLKNVEGASEEKMARKRSSNYSVSAATRGLQTGSRNRNNQEKYRSNNKAVEDLENAQVTSEEVHQFQEDAEFNKNDRK